MSWNELKPSFDRYLEAQLTSNASPQEVLELCLVGASEPRTWCVKHALAGKALLVALVTLHIRFEGCVALTIFDFNFTIFGRPIYPHNDLTQRRAIRIDVRRPIHLSALVL